MGWIFLTLAVVGAPWPYSLLPGLYLSHFDDFYKVFALVQHYPSGSQAAGWRPCPTRTNRGSTSRSRPRRGASPTLTLSLEMLPRWWWWLILMVMKYIKKAKAKESGRFIWFQYFSTEQKYLHTLESKRLEQKQSSLETIPIDSPHPLPFKSISWLFSSARSSCV